MKHLIILGAGGMGKEIFHIAKNSIGYNRDFDIKGFLDKPNSNWNTQVYPPIIGYENDYHIEDDDVFACSIGDVKLRKNVIEAMLQKGAKFMTLIHKNAQIRENVNIGKGCIIESNAIIGSDAIIGNYCLIQANSIIAHDAKIGDWSRFDAMAMCVGGVVIGSSVTVHTAAILSHRVIVEDNATIGACSFVCRKVKAGTVVAGNPAKELLIPQVK